jgi:hypothetical protein
LTAKEGDIDSKKGGIDSKKEGGCSSALKKYEISINQKTSILLSYQSLISYENDVNSDRVHVYKQKVKSICYFVIIIRLNMIKIAFKLIEFFINSDFYHLMIVDHCTRYLYVSRYLTIKFDISKR